MVIRQFIIIYKNLEISVIKLIIYLITIITIIGFLADKKKGDKKKENVPNLTSNPNNMAMNNQQPIQYVQPTMMDNNQIIIFYMLTYYIFLWLFLFF